MADFRCHFVRPDFQLIGIEDNQQLFATSFRLSIYSAVPLAFHFPVLAFLVLISPASRPSVFRRNRPVHRNHLIGNILPVYLRPVPGKDAFVNAPPQGGLAVILQEAAIFLPRNLFRTYPLIYGKIIRMPALFALVDQPYVNLSPVGIDAEVPGAAVDAPAPAAGAEAQDFIPGHRADSVFSFFKIAHFASP